jgi:multidrug efflux pump subunit AcrA (membrane-fusion protein)
MLKYAVATVLVGALIAPGLPSRANAAEPAPARQFVEVSGCRVMFAQSVELASERKGILAELAAPGTEVTAGAAVGSLRDSGLKATLAIAEQEAANDIEVRFAQKAAELSLLKYERAVQANNQIAGTVSELELKELRLAAERSTLQCEQAEHRLLISRLRLDEIRAAVNSLQLVAPFNATVRKVFKQAGEVVYEGEVVAEIVNTQLVQVEGDVDLKDVHRIALKAPVQLRIDGDSLSAGISQRAFSGAITFIDLKVEPVSKKVRIRAELNPTDGLLCEGLSGTMFIATEVLQTARD